MTTFIREITVTSIEEVARLAVELTKAGAVFTCRLRKEGWVFNVTGF